MNHSNAALEPVRHSGIFGEAPRRRYWPGWLGVLVIGCGTATPAGIATDAGSDAKLEVEASAASGGSWCRVQDIFQLKCQRCHQLPPAHGAPFALSTFGDTQVLDSKGVARFERIARVLNDHSMPPLYLELDPPVDPLTETERETILAWCGKPDAAANCDGTP